jgi:hypothetical protein
MAVRQHPFLWSLGLGVILFSGSPELATADGPSDNYKVMHSMGGATHHGLLTVDSSGVSYSESRRQQDNFHLPCSDFLAGTSIQQDPAGAALLVPVHWKDRRLWPETMTGLKPEDVLRRIRAECEVPGGASRLAYSDGVSYKVALAEGVPGFLMGGVLSVRRFTISYSDSDNPARGFGLPCSEFEGNRPVAGWGMADSLLIAGHPLKSREGKLKGAAIYQGIKDACSAQEAGHFEEDQLAVRRELEEAKRRQEAEAVMQQAAAAKRKADFRDGIRAALRAAEEPDPFASIRGEFDLSASDSREWKTSLQLAGADRCALLKTPPSTPTSLSSWTFGCAFRASDEGYEGMVKSVQSVLNLPYQPDEKAVNINQVFFADPSKPARRVFVAKINEATIGISVVAVGSAGALADFNAAQFPSVPTILPTEPTISDEFDKIRSGPHTSMPHAQRSAASDAGASGRTTMTVQNSTAYELSVFFKGPVSKKLTLAPGASQDVDLAPGTFQVAGRVAAANVLPFYGEETYAGSASYSVKFYIGQ